MGLTDLVAPLLDMLASLSGLINSELAMAGLLLVLTASAVGLCVPGLLMPISFSAGLLLEGWLAVPVVTAGAVLGSHGLFLAARRGLGAPIKRRFAGRLERFGPHLGRYGVFYVAGLRVIGTPHALVTLASAASPLRHGRFALATLLGFLPSIAVAAGVGTAL